MVVVVVGSKNCGWRGDWTYPKLPSLKAIQQHMRLVIVG